MVDYVDVQMSRNEPLPMPGGPTKVTSMAGIQRAGNWREDAQDGALPYDTVEDTVRRLHGKSKYQRDYSGLNIGGFNWSGRTDEEQAAMLAEKKSGV